MEGRAVLRQRLLDAGVMMRYDYAWRQGEFGSQVDRLTGCVLRFLYLAGTWTDHLALRVACRSLTPSPALTAALETACRLMQFTLVGEEDDFTTPPHVTFCFIGPTEMGRVDELLFPITADGIYFFLVGDAECLPPPTSGEDERIRGLSAFGIGRELQGCMEVRQCKAMAHYVCEFREAPHIDTLGAVMDQFDVPQSNLMVHTEKWEVYVADSSPIDADVDADEDAFWQRQAKGKVCDNCREARAKLMRCVRCQNAYYCSRECQKEAWKLHKGDCGRPAH
ncbi:Aste57867_11075 [Aphanomyces stellatus]|uniref:Aste57867_11075 protein n=1 Tax=Aphanomyces stellatus TaxID=120398 RepID=A0A485KS41_9STRA|nr:hypothetical protein As57867_011033 [Aphanomyces stellatus]VFT87942.1 Aste57867_11075 [Aphanomyces stellatus]